MTNTVTKLGVVFVLVGTVAMLAPAFGITSITADRAVQVNAAETPATAYLGINETESKEDISRNCFGTLFCSSESAGIITLENNVDSPFDGVSVEVESIAGADASLLKVANKNELTSLDPDDPPQSVELGCGSGSGSATNTQVTLVIDASGSSISVSEATYTADDVTFSCDDDGSAGDGDASDDPVPITDPAIDLGLVTESPISQPPTGSIRQANSSIEFDISNSGSEATITGISLSETGGATYVNNIGGDEVQITGGASEGNIERDGSILIGPDAPRYNLDSQAIVGSGGTVTVELQQFREGNTGELFNQYDMDGETVSLILYVEGTDHPDYQNEVPVEVTFTLPG